MVLQRAVFNATSSYYIKSICRAWLVEPISDPDKERGEIFRYIQLANTAYRAQYKNDILRTLMNYMASYETK